MKFDVHRIEYVRVKVAQVEAPSAEAALEKTRSVDFHAAIDREVDIPVESACGAGAYIASLSFHEAPPGPAMVEISDSHGEQGEHHFDHVDDRFVKVDPAGAADRDANSPSSLFPAQSLNSRAYLGKLAVMEGEHEDMVRVLICAESSDEAARSLAEYAAGYYGEVDQARGNAQEGFDHGTGVLVRPDGVPVSISPASFHELNGFLPTVQQLGCPTPMAFNVKRTREQLPWLLDVAQQALDALDSLGTQIEQMRGMFNDKDGAIADAVQAADHAQLELYALSRYLDTPQDIDHEAHRWYAAGPQLAIVARNTLGALRAAAEQAHQMRDMFNDSDGQIRASLRAGEAAQTRMQDLLELLREHEQASQAMAQSSSESPTSPNARERMRG